MRHAGLGAGVLVVVFTLLGWVADEPSSEPGPTAAVGAARVLDVVDLSPSTLSPSTLSPSTLSPSTLSPSTLPPTTGAPDTGAVASDDVAAFVAELDALRAGRGLDPLVRSADLDGMARGWAERMAVDRHLRHSELIHDVVAGPFTTAGENVGYGPDVAVIFEALVASPGHLDNMVNPAFTRVGIGVVRVGDVLWTAHLFAG